MSLSDEDGALAVVFRMIEQEELQTVADVSVPAVYIHSLLDARNKKLPGCLLVTMSLR